MVSFTDMKGMDDEFCQYLVDQHDDFSKLYSFSKVAENLKDGGVHRIAQNFHGFR